MRDNRWGTTPLLLLRISQFLLGLVVLGISAYFVSRYSGWYIPFTLALAALTLVWVALILGLFFVNSLSPPLVILVDVPIGVSYIVSIATIAINYSPVLSNSCAVAEDLVSADCTTLKGAFGVLIMQMLTFHGAIIWDAIVMYRNPNARVRGARVVPNAARGGGDAGGGQIAEVGGTPVIPKPAGELASPSAPYNQQYQQYQQYQQNRGPPMPPQELSGTY